MDWSEAAAQLAEKLQRRGLHSADVLARIASVPRHLFVPDEQRAAAYDDVALPIGSGQTISQPYIVALMTAAADLTPDASVLEIGTGSGYQAAILAGLCRQVVTVERHPELAARARACWQQLGLDNIVSHGADGTEGWPQTAPYDAVLVTAGAPVVPEPLRAQVADPGRLIIPVGDLEQQTLTRLELRNGEWHSQTLCLCRFVKLLGQHGWQTDPRGA
jgi:protein-L-isoaspartate(D-aspartate) O-methyltransferase